MKAVRDSATDERQPQQNNCSLYHQIIKSNTLYYIIVRPKVARKLANFVCRT